MPIFAASTFAGLNRWESGLVERHVPAGPPPTPLLAVNVAANGSRLWFGIAALLALRPSLRRTAAEGVVAALVAAGITQVVKAAVARRSPALGAALAPLALTLAYGRVRLRVHWPTDVLGGAVLGTVAGRSAQGVATGLRSRWSGLARVRARRARAAERGH